MCVDAQKNYLLYLFDLCTSQFTYLRHHLIKYCNVKMKVVLRTRFVDFYYLPTNHPLSQTKSEKLTILKITAHITLEGLQVHNETSSLANF